MAKGPPDMAIRCSTCGETLRVGEERCPTCGSVVGRHRTPALRQDVRQCTRCGFVGEPVLYFSKGSHRAILVAAGVFTYGIGGLAYYLARRRHPVCARCGIGWEHAREAGGDSAPASAEGDGSSLALAPPPLGGRVRRVAGAALLGVGAFFFVGVGIIENVLEAALLGSGVGVAGSALLLSGRRALQNRRQTIFNRLSRRVLMLARERGSVITVTEVATELDLSLPAAEKLMEAMDDGLRVRSEVSNEGIIYYEFSELKHGAKLREIGPPT